MAYIKLEDALQVCSEAEEWYTETNEQQCAVVSDDIYQQIANLPTADVVEVVRCKNCKHFKSKGTEFLVNDIFGNCEKSSTGLFDDGEEVYGNDYCSYGERRTDDD